MLERKTQTIVNIKTDIPTWKLLEQTSVHSPNLFRPTDYFATILSAQVSDEFNKSVSDLNGVC